TPWKPVRRRAPRDSSATPALRRGVRFGAVSPGQPAPSAGQGPEPPALSASVHGRPLPPAPFVFRTNWISSGLPVSCCSNRGGRRLLPEAVTHFGLDSFSAHLRRAFLRPARAGLTSRDFARWLRLQQAAPRFSEVAVIQDFEWQSSSPALAL